ncbi:MAG: GrpB family protein [Oscillospiraceae bacterium]|nr:GrpB family protein [Oscillospiraceae bacterium]
MLKSEFADYDPSLASEAAETIETLKEIFGDGVSDIRHIGGTSVKKIKSRPVIDIVVGFKEANLIIPEKLRGVLRKRGFIADARNINDGQKIFFKYGGVKNKRRVVTHVVRVVLHNGRKWFEYLIFSDYLNINESRAREYEILKLSSDGKRRYALTSYIKEKSAFIKKTISDNFYMMMLGRNVDIDLIDSDLNRIKNLNHEAYIIGSDKKIKSNRGEFNGDIAAYIKDKTRNRNIFIVSDRGAVIYEPEIREALKIYNKGSCEIVCLYEKSCGAVLYAREKREKNDGDGNLKFLLVRGRASSRVGFPKGHIEAGESEEETAKREIYEETSLNPVLIHDDFREERSYVIGGYIKKTVAYFLAEFNISDKYKIRDKEILEQRLVSYDKAYLLLTFNQDKEILKKAYDKIKNIK